MTAADPHPFSAVDEPALAVRDERRGLLAVAGRRGHDVPAPVAVYDTSDLSCRVLVHSRFPVHAMAFHPALSLLAVGTGRYDGGYFFEGELLLVHLEADETRTLIEHEGGRQVLGLEWVDEHVLRVLMAPPDDWQDEQARVEGHVAVVHRDDWAAVPARSLTGRDLAGPRVPAPRPDGREAARQMLAEGSAARRVQRADHSADL
ncbi:hypothetical protein [Streptomyces caniscabiei]|uniref:Uncharacterized protein n=1 Tax=Streptomyces caniscabiei TaxID=2746961 RepID=A0A927QLN5_9ACTN|nr:hypothetical protein [Streptomyces caniscabiei]MBD9726117.1 hypothetical protein [Streptomyces caniscabiei]MDX3512552.1 hypothetical protein [Streptomyces caniscabiei]MDX3721641.1 hypothetical protein [Streptomyces caniscabiei]MDX3729748.1 hypothetical protein [Streptomyces caniscabiei]WEO28515.1 hypothetical protein IHE65_38065 [Streptomyces caniscabiei]